MDKKRLAAYFTLEFTQNFPPNKYLSSPGSEVKLWLCPTLGMPVFSNAEYGGPNSASFLPVIGKPTIHIRTIHLEASEFDYSDPDVTERIHHRMLQYIFEKILLQIDLLYKEASSSKNLLSSIEGNQEKISAILSILKNTQGNQHGKTILH